MSDGKFKLDDSIFEDNDVKIEKEKENKNKNKLQEEISMDDLFDFKPIGTVGDEDSFIKNTLSTNNSDKKENLTKKQKLQSLLDEKIGDTFIDENKMQHKEEPKSENKFDSIFKEEVVLFDKEQTNLEKEEEESINYDENKIRSLIESALYVCGNEGLSLNELKRLTNAPTSDIKRIIKKWNDELENDETRGISIRIYGERYKLFSKNENREDLSRLITIKYRNPLSSKVMETLAIIAYNQPCTRAIIEDIRGKDPTATIQKLIDLELVSEAGRADTPGRPLLYTVTHKFYDIFGIKNLSELPKINIDQPFDDQDISFFDTTRFND